MKHPDKEEFRRWLQSLADKVVGRACDDGDCPLAKYLIDITGVNISVGNKTIFYTSDLSKDGSEPLAWPSIALEAWAESFIRHLDNTYDDEDDGETYVTGAEALMCLV